MLFRTGSPQFVFLLGQPEVLVCTFVIICVPLAYVSVFKVCPSSNL